MNIRPKTVRRLLYLLAVCVLVAVAALVFRQYKDSQRRARLNDAREAGIAAFKQGNYPAALEFLKQYIRNDTVSDFDAVLAFATSRAKVETPDGRHINEAIKHFVYLRSVRPDDPAVFEPLLDLYTRAGQQAEAIDLANVVLAQSPNHPGALRAKSISLLKGARYDEALQVSTQLNAADPSDLQGHIQTYWLLHRTKTPIEKIVQRYQALLDASPGDARFEMLLGVAVGESGDTEKALALLRSAAARPKLDAALVAQLARMFDQQGLYDEARELLERSTAGSPADPATLRVLLQRLWQQGRYNDVLSRVSGFDPASPATDSSVLAYGALAMLTTGRTDDAEALLDRLSARTGDNAAQGWSAAIRTRLDSPGVPPPQLISRYQAAMSRGGDAAILRLWIGEAHFSMGETEQAVREWQQAAELMPSWAEPHLQIARAMMAANRPADAADAAANAVRCAPDQVAPAAALALAQYTLLQQNPSTDGFARLTTDVAAIQKLRPGEPQTLPLYAAMLCRQNDKARAVDVIRAAFVNSSQWDAGVLSALLSVTREYGLGLEADLLDATRVAAEKTPAIAMRHAIELDHAGRPEEGLRMLQRGAQAASGADAMRWQVAIAQYREAIGDPDAPAAWIALGDANPTDFILQATILRAAAAQTDREFYARTIDRVKSLTGPDGTLWRYARARFLLSHQPSEKESAEAASLLIDLVRVNPTVAEYRIRLAQAQENLGRTLEAAEQLRAAVEMDPRSVSVQLELARLLAEQGKHADARTYLERAAASPLIEAVQRVQLAQMLSTEGRAELAIGVLEQSASRDVQGDILLAQMYRRTGRTTDAERIFNTLLRRDEPKAPPADAISAAADFYAAQGDLPRARAVLAQLEAGDYAPIVKQSVVARFEERHGDRDKARQLLTAAVEQAPADAGAWRRLASFEARQGNYPAAVAAADRGLQVLPGNVELSSLRLQAQAMQQVVASGKNDLSPLIEVLSQTRTRAAEADALSALRDALATAQPTGAKLARLRQSADRFPRFLPLQAILARSYLQSDMIDDAVNLADRLLDNLPGEPEAAALATTIYRASRQWAPMKQAAGQWRKLLPGGSSDAVRPADLAIAEACSNLQQPAEVIAALQPHLVDAARAPEENATLLRLAASAMLASNQPERADDLLGPLLPTSKPARVIWLRITAEPAMPPPLANEWLARAAAAIDPSAVDEATAYARAASVVATRYGDPQPIRNAIDVLRRHTIEPRPDPEAMFLTAALHMQLGQLADAERMYRSVIAARPDYAEARNDLAYVLLLRNGDLKEARSLAATAAAATPDNSNMHETLGRICAALDDRPAAMAAYDRALQLNGSNLDALIGKAHLLRQQGQSAEARKLMARITPMLNSAPPLAEPVRVQLEQLRTQQSRGE